LSQGGEECKDQVEAMQLLTIKGILELGDSGQAAQIIKNMATEFNVDLNED